MSDYTVTATTDTDYAANLTQLKDRLSRPLHFLHAPFYGGWQQRSGKRVLYFAVHKSHELIGCGMAIEYPLPGGFSYLYSPYGPLLTEWSVGATAALIHFFKQQKANKLLLFARFDCPDLPRESFTMPTNAVAATASLQPRREWALDISASADEILAGFYKTARYQIRFAERSNTTIRFEKFTPAQLDKFYELMTTTADRNHFGIMSKSYYRAVFEELAGTEHSFLGFADVNGTPAAAVVMASYDGQIHYVFGCSSSEFRKIAPSYLLLWKSMLKAKENGDRIFNFGGITDDIKSTHLQGVTDFKKRFGGYAIEHAKPSDIVLSPLGYKLFGFYKKIQRG